jgi:hypothetical protein
MNELPRTPKPVERVAAGSIGGLQPGSKHPKTGLLTPNTGASVGAHRFRFLVRPRKTGQCPRRWGWAFDLHWGQIWSLN